MFENIKYKISKCTTSCTFVLGYEFARTLYTCIACIHVQVKSRKQVNCILMLNQTVNGKIADLPRLGIKYNIFKIESSYKYPFSEVLFRSKVFISYYV